MCRGSDREKVGCFFSLLYNGVCINGLMDQDHLIWGTRLTSCLEKCPAAWCDFPCQQKQHSLSVMSLPRHKHTFTNSSPVYLLYLSPRQVAACLSTNPLNWAAWMLSCTWRVRFLMKALFYCSLLFTISLWSWRNVNERKKHNLQKSTSLKEHTCCKGMKKKLYFLVCFVYFLGEFQDIHLPFGMSRNVFF